MGEGKPDRYAGIHCTVATVNCTLVSAVYYLWYTPQDLPHPEAVASVPIGFHGTSTLYG